MKRLLFRRTRKGVSETQMDTQKPTDNAVIR